MDLIIIGGSGFVSGTLARVARTAGHRVWVLTRGQRPVPEGVTALTADRSDEAAFAAALASGGLRWDLVVDCIGYKPEDARQDVAVFRDRARHLVFISTDFVFDPGRRRFPQPEGGPHYLAEGYGGNKRRCELELSAADTGEMAWTVLRPCHIYGPGSRLGCLPQHGRDPELVDRIRAGEALRLAGGGYFLQQPVSARDLAKTILSVPGAAAAGEIYQVAGPDIIESRTYYRIVGDVLGVDEVRVTEVPVDAYRAESPESAPFLCHRIYDLSKLREHGLSVPATPIAQGLREHVESLLEEDNDSGA